MTDSIKAPKKLIEVALPLDDINREAAREKSIRHGHPSTLHLWWARRPLAAARAVLFAQLVNDPGGERGYYAGKTKAQADAEREELFEIIRELVKWENTNNSKVLNRAREAIKKSWRETCELNKGKPGFDPDKLPAFHDPFAGGGTIPLEAQRLGLESYASDLNPVAVLINKAMIEIPPKFAGQAPVGPLPPHQKQTAMRTDWPGTAGLAEDVCRYGAWMRDEAEKRIGHLYPKVEVTAEMVAERPDLKPYLGRNLTVIAWLWARTVKSPNPAFATVDVPLASTFMLSTKNGKEAYVEPLIEGGGYRFTVKMGKPPDPEAAKAGTKLGRGANFQCLMSGAPVAGQYIKAEGKAGRMGARLMAIVAEGDRGRVYLAPTPEHEMAALEAKPEWKPGVTISGSTQYLGVKPYGMDRFDQLFTPRQLVALTAFSDLVQEARERLQRDALQAGISTDPKPLREGGAGSTAYAEAVAVYLAFSISKCADYWNTSATWMPRGTVGHLFARQAIQMTWDYPEANPLSEFHCAWHEAFHWVSKAIKTLPGIGHGLAQQLDAATQSVAANLVVSTDPPYYDNVPYADISDFFYVWLRRSLQRALPELFSTLAVPKAEELVAFAYRHKDGKAGAETFFLDGMTRAMHRLAEQTHPAFPVTIYYAFKQAESDSEAGTSSTGWETFLDAVIRAGFAIGGTWPMRTEREVRSRGIGSNALASSIILVCRRRPVGTSSVSRREFQRELREQMSEALETMIGGKAGASPIAPVDLAQAAIGPGMAIFSKHAAVLEADGTPMSVRSALVLINKEIDAFLNPEGAGFDSDTLFCSAWFDQNGWNAGRYGDAETLSRAKGTSVEGVREAGIIESGGGKVRLLGWEEYPANWDPEKDTRLPVWEATHHLIRALNTQGESAAGALLARMPERAEQIRQLAYHLYTLCERKKWAEHARAYNELITSWYGITAASHEVGQRDQQVEMQF